MGRGRRYNEEIKTLARKRFKILGDARAVALEMGIPVRTVQGWAQRYRWGQPIIREVQARIASAGAEICADATERLVALADVALEDTLDKIPEIFIRNRGEGARAAHDLAKTRNLIVGKADGEGTGQEFTIRTLVFLATGSDPKGNFIEGSIKDPAPPPVLLARDGEKIEAECRTAEGDDGKEKV